MPSLFSKQTSLTLRHIKRPGSPHSTVGTVLWCEFTPWVRLDGAGSAAASPLGECLSSWEAEKEQANGEPTLRGCLSMSLLPC